MDELLPALRWAFGIDVDPKSYNLLQISLRALLVYIGGLTILRVGEHRFLGKEAAFDIILGFVVGSMLSRAINGSSPLLLSIFGVALLVTIHWLLATIAIRSDRFSHLVKGSPHLLVRGGEVDWRRMRRLRLGRHDLEEASRLKARLRDLGDVEEARFERNGEISVVPKKRGEPKVVEVEVAAGVQRVRIEIG